MFRKQLQNPSKKGSSLSTGMHMHISAMDTAINTTFKHVSGGLRGYTLHKHRGPCFLIMGTLK